MNRRGFLAMFGSSLVAGCAGISSNSTGPDGDEVNPTTGEPVECTRYAFGDWHALDEWRVTVSSLDRTTTFHVDGVEREFEMPEDEQLVVATVRLENTTSETRGWAAGSFTILVGDTTYEPQRAFEHPAFSYAVDVSRLRDVAHQEQFQTSGFGVAGGRTATLWLVAVVPRTVSRDETAVGYDDRFDDDVRYPVRWVPDGTAE